ncbi:MAG: RNA 2',3'-cyclic phosphodiesterase [Candidatus Omnitrophica bacterium]|nr:RNA 2',3'-cyclic phosphodiesterase [Candidatus Omnitrophota bacterium]
MSRSARRIFLALPLADVFFQEISDFLDEIKSKMEGVSWVRPENVHVTLHFFGSMTDEKIEKISPAVRLHAANFSSLALSLHGIGCFPNQHKPHVIWLGMSGDVGLLENLHSAITQDLEKLGFPIEKRPFQAHATLGRPKVFHPTQERALSVLKGPETPPRKISHLVLYESHLSPQGSRYEAIEKFELSG